MERNEVSSHEVRLYRAAKASGATWLTSQDLAQAAGVASRTARAHAAKLVKLGILDLAEVFPAHRYRFSDKADKRNQAYIHRLDKAAEVFGL